MDLFLCTWCSCPNDQDEQRFLGVMSHVCFKYLENDKETFANIMNITDEQIRKKRKRIVSQLYAIDVDKFTNIMKSIQEHWIIILDNIKLANKETPDPEEWLVMLMDYVNACINKDKFASFRHKESEWLESYLDRLEAEILNSPNYVSVQKNVDSLITLSNQLFSLLGSIYSYQDNIITEFAFKINGTAMIWMNFLTVEKSYRYEVDIPETFNTKEFPLLTFNKCITVVSSFALD
jgi:hypothetical protein